MKGTITFADIPEDFKPLMEVCKDLPESVYVLVQLSLFKGNPIHPAILYTGYKHGGYRTIWNASYEGEIKDERVLAQAMVKVCRVLEDWSKA